MSDVSMPSASPSPSLPSASSSSSVEVRTETTHPSPRLGRVGPVMFLAHFGWLLPAAAGATLIQALLTRIDAEAKLALYATLSTVGAVGATLANVAFGVLSDRTRSRYGRRNPWIVGGGLAAAASLSAMSLVRDFATLVALWMVFQIALNAFLGPLIAILPDRVSAADLGKASSCVGAGQLVAQSVAGIVAGLFLAVPAEGLRWIPWLLAAGALLVFFLLPDRSNRHEPREPLALAALLRNLLPPRDADFAWALVGRFLGMLSLFLVLMYQLYTLTDYLGLGTSDAAKAIATGGVVMAVASGAAIALAGPLSDRLGRRKVFVAASSLLMGAAALPLALTPSLWAFHAFLAVGGFGFGAYLAVDQALIAEVLPSQAHAAKDMGILNIANTAPQIVAPVIAVVIVPGLGFRGLFLLATGCAVAGALCVKPIRRVR
ncbi:MFS transporter [Streptomyces vilmorinianum]|uniref:MFS transporter n=1 Tax=Streptomyces vilmorinianum TaxID=3051092 RepID=UPI001C30662E|nr:MFS transporter [Streptomyces vilmorinianum]